MSETLGCHGAKNALRKAFRRVIAVAAPDTMMRGAIIHHNHSDHRA